MSQPLGFNVYEGSHLICHLHKSFYSLKQSLLVQFNRFSNTLCGYVNLNLRDMMLITLSFINTFYPNVFYYLSMLITLLLLKVILLIYLESRPCCRNNLSLNIQTTSSSLNIKVVEGVMISQRKYIIDLLTKIDMIRAKLISILMDPHLELSLLEREFLANHDRYQ